MPPTPTSITIGIDIGGTRMRAAAVDPTGRLLARHQSDTTRVRDAQGLIDWIVESAASIRREIGTEPGAMPPLGLALPGTLDRDRRTVVRSVNLPYLEACPLVEALTHRLGTGPALLTDAEAATWGEYVSRKPRPLRFVHLRLGTGVACGVVVDDRLQRLDAGRRTHLEWLVVDTAATARPCRCGRRGCLETIASGPALEQAAAPWAHPPGLAAIQEAWEQGDTLATPLLQEAADTVNTALMNLASRFDARVLCLGGGVVERLPGLWMETVKRWDPGAGRGDDTPPRLEAAVLGDDAGVVGAAMYVMDPPARSAPPPPRDP